MFALALLVVAPLLVTAGPLHKRISGSATYYIVETGNAGSCGSYLHNGDFVVAMNQQQYNQGMCGQTVTITANGKTAQAQIMDLCPTGGGNCFYGDMDLSPGLFGYFASLDAGKISIEWNFGGNAPQPQPQPQPEPTTTQAPPPPPPPPTTTSSTYSPPPPPTSTSSPQPSSTTSSSSSSVPPSSSSSLAASTGSTTQSGAPQQTGSSNDVNTESAAGESNLSNLAQAFVNMGEMVRVAGQLGA